MRIIDDMRKIAKKKKAFTLVELMGVLVIIGVLTMILIPVINNVLKNHKQDTYNKQLDSIKLSAKNFGSDNHYVLPESEGESIFITLEQLRVMGYVEGSIINPLTKKEISRCTIIEINKTNNNFEYIINEDTLDDESCVVQTSNIYISTPSNEYIKNKAISYYIISVKNTEQDLFVNYNLDNTKINLIGEASEDAKFKITGGHGIYKLTIQGGEVDGELGFELNSNFITDESGKDVIGSNPIIPTETLIVDNTAPIITSIDNPNYGSDWKNKESTLAYNLDINADETGSGINVWQYSYSENPKEGCKDSDSCWMTYNNYDIVGTDNNLNNITTTEFTSDRNQNVYIRACDMAGNCSESTPSFIKIDTTLPTVPTITLTHSQDTTKPNGSQATIYTNDTWINKSRVYLTDARVQPFVGPSSTDNVSGVKEYQVSTDNVNWTTYNYNASDDTYMIKTQGTNKRYIRAIDNAGNISEPAIKTIKIDTEKPNIVKMDACPLDIHYAAENKLYTKCYYFKVTDNLSSTLELSRSHCVDATPTTYNPQMNTCKTSSGATTYNAYNRLNYYITNGTFMTISGQTDNKTVKKSYTANTLIPLGTTYTDTYTVKYAFYVCDEAGNCSGIKEASV